MTSKTKILQVGNNNHPHFLKPIYKSKTHYLYKCTCGFTEIEILELKK